MPPRVPTGRPTISNATETSLTLSWPAARLPAYLKNTKVDYIVEAKEGSSRLWANLAENVSGTTYKVGNCHAWLPVSRFGLAVRRQAGRQEDLGLIPLRLSVKRSWFVDTVLWLCPSLPTETLKWLSSLPILMQESFWWWQCIDRYIISLFPHLHNPFPPPPPFSPSLKNIWFLWTLSTMFTCLIVITCAFLPHISVGGWKEEMVSE